MKRWRETTLNNKKQKRCSFDKLICSLPRVGSDTGLSEIDKDTKSFVDISDIQESIHEVRAVSVLISKQDEC